MVKSKKLSKGQEKGELGFADLPKSFVCTDVFLKKKLLAMLVSYVLVQVLVLMGVLIFGNHIENYSLLKDVHLIFGVLVVVFLMFFFYALFYVFLNAFAEGGRDFFEGFLVFCVSTLHMFILGNLFNVIGKFVADASVMYFLFLVFLVVFVYYLVNVNLIFKKYYGTSIFKVLASYILTLFMFFFVIVILEVLATSAYRLAG